MADAKREADSESKVCIVTGAGSGIGRAATITLLRAGHRLVLAGRRLEKLEETLSQAGNVADRALIIPTDVADADAVESLFDQTHNAFGRLDVLFNNAGVSMPCTPVDEVTLEEWRRMVDINLTGMFLCLRAAYRIMKSQSPSGGRIINNGSISAFTPRIGSAPYTATKHGVTGLTKATALDGRKHLIACSQIDIGNAATEMSAGVTNGAPQADGSTVVEPRIDVQHIAEAILYLANLPPDVNVPTMTVMATQMPYIGRG